MLSSLRQIKFGFVPGDSTANQQISLYDTFCQALDAGITKTRLFKYIENFTSIKTENFQIKNPDNFHIFAQNINCGYSLEPPRRGGSNEYHNLCFEQK